MIRATATALFVSSVLCVLSVLSGIPGAAAIKVGTLSATAVYLGAEKVWPPEQEPPPPQAGFRLRRTDGGSGLVPNVLQTANTFAGFIPSIPITMVLEARKAEAADPGVTAGVSLGPCTLYDVASASFGRHRSGLRGPTAAAQGAGVVPVNGSRAGTLEFGLVDLWEDMAWHAVTISNDVTHIDGRAFQMTTLITPTSGSELKFSLSWGSNVAEMCFRRIAFFNGDTGEPIMDVRYDGAELVNIADGSPLVVHPNFEVAPLE